MARKPDETGTLATTADEARARARRLRAEIEAGRDRIAQLDLDLEDRLAALGAFDATLRAQLRAERRTLSRTQALRRMLERWAIALEERPPERVARAGEDIEARRVRELAAREAEQARADAGAEGTAEEVGEEAAISAGPPASASDELKSAYRRLARRFHPDLARSEDDRVAFGRLMARINAAYHAGDLDRLAALDHAPAPDQLDPHDLDALAGDALRARIDELVRERDEVDRVLEDLEARLAQVDRTPTWQLWQRWQQAAEAGEDFFATMREQLRARAQDAQAGIGAAIAGLQDAVDRYNRRQPRERHALASQAARGLVRRFDPDGAHRLARLLLDELDVDRSDPAVASEAGRIEALASEAPARLRLLLLAYVAQLSDQALPGLERHEDFELRFEHLSLDDAEPVSLTTVMAELADVLEFGVRSADAERVRLGFRFRSERVRAAMPLALLRAPVRRELRRVLRVLGEATTCSACGQEVFPIPLFRSAGFDSLRAEVCPSCGHAQRRYWLPRGDDVQALLNPAYLELEIVSEWSFHLGGERGFTQLLPVEADAMTVGDLEQRIFTDLLERYEIPIRRGQLCLEQGNGRVSEKTPLSALDDHAFNLVFAKTVDLEEADAAQLLRHRIRHRFD